MNKLKICWGHNDIKIIEPSGKIHHSDKNNLIDGINLLDLMFLKKYQGQRVILYWSERGYAEEKELTNVSVSEHGAHQFELL